jgi:hypothetical protein
MQEVGMSSAHDADWRKIGNGGFYRGGSLWDGRAISVVAALVA